MNLKFTTVFVVHILLSHYVQYSFGINQHYALMTFYNSTNGLSWVKNDGWGTADPTSVCSIPWYGITCDGDGNVVKVVLTQNGLLGSLPVTGGLGGLSYLEVLNLEDNHGLTGTIPTELSNCTQLTTLSLGKTGLVGVLPSWIGNLTRLTSLSIGGPYATPFGVTGTLPMSLGALLKLETLDLRNNGLIGEIPCCFENLTVSGALRTLRLDNNYLNGSVPSYLSSVSSLSMTNNTFDGPCPKPSWLSSVSDYPCATQAPDIPVDELTALFNFYIDAEGANWQHRNGWPNPPVCGVWYGVTCSEAPYHVTGLSLTSNKLRGKFSPFLGNLTNLQVLNLEDNDLLSGTLPETYSQLLQLTSFNVIKTAVSGTVPEWLNKLPKLVNVSAGGTYGLPGGFTGTVPQELFFSPSIRSLVLANGGLTGTIPSPPEDGAYSLKVLILSDNFLNGTVPLELASLDTLELYNNSFTGPCPKPVFLHKDSDYSCPPPPHDVPTVEYNALLSIYYNSVGAHWKTKTNWGNNDVCTWHGITCTLLKNIDNQTHVTGLDLSKNGLENHFAPQDFTNLTYLSVLDVHNNPKLGGSLPSALQNLTYLTSMAWDATRIVGTLPDWIGTLTKLETLRVGAVAGSTYGMSGTLPMSVQHLTALKTLVLSQNAFSGDVPCCWSALNQTLQQLELQSNYLNSTDGMVPSFLQGFASVDLRNNSYIGPCTDQYAHVLVDYSCGRSPSSPDSATTSTLSLAGKVGIVVVAIGSVLCVVYYVLLVLHRKSVVTLPSWCPGVRGSRVSSYTVGLTEEDMSILTTYETDRSKGGTF